MQVQVIHGEEEAILGINLESEGDADSQVLEKFSREGMVPVSHRPGKSLVVAFGHRSGAETDEESEEDITPTEASRWIG